MTLNEYNEIKNLNYFEYVEYLKEKYGESKYDYMTKTYNKNPKATRTKEGLFCHHVYEFKTIMLSHKGYAERSPFEWQLKENLVYCDYLEHLLLHILICDLYDKNDDNKIQDAFVEGGVAPGQVPGVGGVVNFLVPELNDLYSGMPINLDWKKNCFDKVKDDLNCYITLVKRFYLEHQNYPCYDKNFIFRSFDEAYGTWSRSKNTQLTEKILSMINDKSVAY